MLKGLDAVRKRPGMYIGDTDDGSGLHHMVYEVVDNAIDEMLAGHATECHVTLNADGSCTVRDNGRGIPDRHQAGRRPRSEALGRRDRVHRAARGRQVRPELLQGLRRPARRRRVGRQRAVDVAQGAHLARRQGALHRVPRRRAGRAAEGRRRRRTAERGTEVSFLPSPKTFTMVEFDYTTLEHRLRELAFLNSGAKIVLTDARHADVKTEEMLLRGRHRRVRAAISTAPSTALIAEPIMIRGEKDGITRRGRAVVERQLPRERAVLHQQHPAARRRHASGRLPRRR